MINPVLRRELLQQFRSGKTLAAILVVAVSTGVLVLLRWPAEPTADVLSRRSLEVFRPLAYALAVATTLLVPAFPATSIIRERKQRTLALLMQAPLSSGAIYAGKFFGNVLLAMVLLSAAVPAATASYAMGGISWVGQVVPLFVLLLAMTVQYTALALWISSRAGSSDESLRWSYAAVLLLSVVTLAPSLLWAAADGWRRTAAQLCQNISPWPAVGEIVGDPGIASGGLMEATAGIAPFLIWTVGIASVAFLLTLRQLRPSAHERARANVAVTEQRSLLRRVIRRLMFVVDPNRRKPGIPRLVNPVMVKEFRTRRFGRLHWLLRLVAACAVVSMALAVIATTGTLDWGVARIAGALVILQLVLLVLMGPSLASSLIAGERESGGWQLLRMTPMSVRRILSGKLFSVLWSLVLVLMATLPGYLVMVLIEPSLALQVQRVSVCLAVTALLVLSISTCVSAFHRRTAVATVTNYVLLLVLFAGTLLVWLARDRPFGHQVVERTLLLNPTAAALAEIQMPGFESYQLLPAAWWVGTALSAIALLLLIIQTWRLSRPE